MPRQVSTARVKELFGEFSYTDLDGALFFAHLSC